MRGLAVWGSIGPLALASAWHRRVALGIALVSVSLSAFLLASVEQLRQGVREGFAQAVSGTDLIVGPRTGQVQLLLYSVFHLGQPSHNMRWSSVQALAAHPAVAWVVPLALGDSHRGFPVVATSTGLFEHVRVADGQPLRLAQGRRFEGLADAVIGAEVARSLGYAVGTRLVLAHGDGALEHNDHADHPFTVVGVLAPTGTPVDRAVHVRLEAMGWLHAGWMGGMPPAPSLDAPHREPPGDQEPPESHDEHDHDHGHNHDHDHNHNQDPVRHDDHAAPAASDPALQPGAMARWQPREVTAALVGLHQRAAVFGVQRWLNEHSAEPLMGVLPGVALDELWQVLGGVERALLAISGLVAVVSLAGLMATLLAGLNERRRELAVLRAVGASPRMVLALLLVEGGLLSALGVALGWACACGLMALGQGWALAHWGVHLGSGWPTAGQAWTMLAVVGTGLLASLLPAWRAYRLSLHDGLNAGL